MYIVSDKTLINWRFYESLINYTLDKENGFPLRNIIKQLLILFVLLQTVETM